MSKKPLYIVITQKYLKSYVHLDTELTTTLERCVVWCQICTPVCKELLRPQGPQSVVTSATNAVVLASHHESVVNMERILGSDNKKDL